MDKKRENDQFKFDLNAKQVRITDSEMIGSLQQFYEIVKRPFTTQEYDNWDDRICTSQAIFRRFGSWRKALTRIGVTSGIQAHTYTTEELMDNLEIIWRELGYPPGKRMLSRRGYKISERPYINRWGSVANACRQLKLFKEGKIKQSDLLGTQKVSSRKSIDLKLRWSVMQRDHFQCVKCGRSSPVVQLQVDHIVPRSKGGPDIEANLQTLCNECNAGKSNRDE
jgi:hypothetical protein